MNDDLIKKERQAIKLLKSAGDKPLEICFSGGKDSEVILALAEMAGVNYRAIYRNTTIDPPGTISHCLSKGVEMVRPEMSFLQIIENNGFPTMWRRVCCGILKEYKIMNYAVQGVRRAESVKRANRYHEPVVCRHYSKSERVEVYYPILEWTDDDVAEFITQNNIQCHPLYYDEQGKFHVERRLGCIGCPLKSDKGVADFKRYPKLLRAMVRAGKVWWNKPRKKELASKRKFGDIYGLLYNDLFCDSYADYVQATTQLFGKRDLKKEMEDYFKIEL